MNKQNSNNIILQKQNNPKLRNEPNFKLQESIIILEIPNPNPIINKPIMKDEDFCISLSTFINLNLYMP